MDFHEAANIFPIDEESIPTLAEDIRENGQRVEIEVMDGKILDGRRRWKACEIAKVKPKVKEVSVADAVAYVLSLNLHRRHLTPSQLSMVGARARVIYDARAKERQKEGQKSGGQTSGRGRNKSGDSLVESLPPSYDGKARDEVGKAVGVSGKSIDYATRVIENAVPEVVKAVDEGRMAVSTAAILSYEPEQQQIEEATKPKRNREYVTQSRAYRKDADATIEIEEGKVRGSGVIRANEAINCLSRIPKNDALRKRGFQLVTDWIKRNR